MPREFEYIEWIGRHVPPDSRVLLGIGDDTAVIAPRGAGPYSFAADMLLDGVHFTSPPATAELIGRKALAVNLSDLAAMAAKPWAAVVSVAFPHGRPNDFIEGVHRGLQQLAGEFDMVIAGGDTNAWDGPLVINVAVLGEHDGKPPVTRGGAQPGDWLLVTGPLGGSLVSGRHLTFTPRIGEAQRLVQSADIHAMIDLSDGLASDLKHITHQSHVGAVIWADRVPVDSDATKGTTELPGWRHAIGDGEDFELLFAVSESDGRRLLKSPPAGVVLTLVGQCTESQEVRLELPDGSFQDLTGGWEHSL